MIKAVGDRELSESEKTRVVRQRTKNEAGETVVEVC